MGGFVSDFTQNLVFSSIRYRMTSGNQDVKTMYQTLASSPVAQAEPDPVTERKTLVFLFEKLEGSNTGKSHSSSRFLTSCNVSQKFCQFCSCF